MIHSARFFVWGLFAAQLAIASPQAAETAPFTHLGSASQQEAAREWNHSHSIGASHFRPGMAFTFLDVPTPAWSVASPFSEFEKTGYVALSGKNAYEIPQLRDAVASHLPPDVSLIIYVDDRSEIPALQAQYQPRLANRLQFVVVPYGQDELWGRDSLPFPVHLKESPASHGAAFGLVNSIYPQNFSPDSAISDVLSLPMTNSNIYFRGGNLLLDDKDNCFAENASEVSEMSDPISFFKTYFGCATVTILPKASDGIGDIDERIKFLGKGVALTDYDDYAATLKKMGYDVHMIPSVGVSGETYMNTLLVNGTIFVPQMGAARDQAALDAYKALGLNPIGVFTQSLADQGKGNIHCVSMNYPPGAFRAN